jgi:hypothetical protein
MLTSDGNGRVLEWGLPNPRTAPEEAETHAEEAGPNAKGPKSPTDPWPICPKTPGGPIWVGSMQVCGIPPQNTMHGYDPTLQGAS